MKIENADALKQWLVNYLQPIFDGDPDKLAMYIVAYSKKIENDQASRERCIKDLEVFLESNTNSFVDTLFETLVSKKYLNPNNTTITSNPTTQPPTESKTEEKKKDYNELSSTKYERERDRSKRFNSSYDDSRRQRHSADHYSNRSSGGNGYRARQSRDYQEIDANRSRSNKTRYKNRSRNRHRDASSSSSSSSSSNNPTSSRRFEGERKSTYRRSYSRSRSNSPRNRPIEETKKQRCKVFDEEGICRQGELCPYDHGDEPIIQHVIPQQQMNSSDINSNQLLQQQNNYPINNQYYNNNLNQNDTFNQRRNNQKRNNQHLNKSNGPGLLPMPTNFQQQRFNNSNTNNNLRNNNTHQQSQQQQPIANQNDQQTYQQRQQISSNNRPRNLVNIVTSIPQDDLTADLAGFNQQQILQQPPQQRGIKRSYYNNSSNNNINYSNNNLNSQSIITNLHSDSNTQIQPALLPTPNQATPQPQNNKLQNQNSTLILRKVPLDLNKVDKMRQHFSKFGQILDIQCQYENNNDATLIQFANNQQALAAYKSPQSVFNNRFIRIYWLSNYQKHQQQNQQQQQINNSDEPLVKRPVKESFDSNELHSTETKENIANSNIKTDETNDVNKSNLNSTNQQQQQDASQTSQNLSTNFNSLSLNKKISYENAAKAIQDENQKKVLMLKLEVKQKARELIEKQIKDQKLLLQKYEQAKTKEEKNQILELIKQLSASIEKEKEILSNKNFDVSSSSSSPFSTQSPFSLQKVPPKNLIIPPPIHHLKLNNKRLNNTNFLKVAQASKQTVVTAASKMTPSIVQSPFNYARVDNRPKELLVTCDSQEKINLINFIKTIGCQIDTVNEISETASSISFSINFTSRKDAEIAFTKCSSTLASKQISITWLKSDQSSNKKGQISDETTTIMPNSEDSDNNRKEIQQQETKDLIDEDSKSKDKLSGLNEESSLTTESAGNEIPYQENKEFVDALFDDNTNYENIIN